MKAGLLRSSGLLALCVYFLALHHCLSYARADVVLSNAQLRATLVSQGGLINIVQTNDNSTKQFSLQTKIMTEMAQSSTDLLVHVHPRALDVGMTHLFFPPFSSFFMMMQLPWGV